MDTSKYTKLSLLSAQLSVEIFPAEQVISIATDLSTAVDSKVETAVGAVHTHSNKAVLDGITAEQVTAWDGAEAAAKSYADGKVAALSDTYDTKGSAAAAQTAANGYTDTALVAAKSYADGLASNYDAAGAASTAETAAKGYTDTAIAGLSNVYDAKGAAAAAETSAKGYTDTTVTNLINGAPEAYDTLKEIADWIANDESGVSALTNRVAALETGKADLSAVTTLGSEVSQMSTTVGNHTADTDIHVTAADKTAWNGKQDALNAAQLSAVNSGVDADWKTALDNWKSATQGAVEGITSALSGKASTSSVETLAGTVDGLGGTVTDITTSLNTASQMQKLPTDGSISTRDIIVKVNAIIDAFAVQHVEETPGG